MERNVTCKTLPVSRALGHTAVGGAAYRAGENIKARGQGADGGDKWYRYSNRRDTVRETFIMAPPDAPEFAKNWAELWNRVEEFETRKNARLGRDTQLGFAYELPKAEQRKLVEEFAQREFVSRGFIADVAIHDYGRSIPAMGGSEKQQQKIRDLAAAEIPFLELEDAKASEKVHVMIARNKVGEVTAYKLYQPHAHVRITPRAVEDGEWVENKKASRYFNRDETAMNWRYDWPKLQNAYLERVGSDVRVTSTSYEEDGWPDVPRKATGGNTATHAIEERSHELTDEQRAKHDEAMAAEERDRKFREIHNETIRRAFDEINASTADEDSHQRRMAAWWKNAQTRYDYWKQDFQEKASEWGERIRLQKDRIKSVFRSSDNEVETPPPADAEPPAHDERDERDERERDR